MAHQPIQVYASVENASNSWMLSYGVIRFLLQHADYTDCLSGGKRSLLVLYLQSFLGLSMQVLILLNFNPSDDIFEIQIDYADPLVAIRDCS
jgi:hypothetical protein